MGQWLISGVDEGHLLVWIHVCDIGRELCRRVKRFAITGGSLPLTDTKSAAADEHRSHGPSPMVSCPQQLSRLGLSTVVLIVQQEGLL
jgi:hypothetical protein